LEIPNRGKRSVVLDLTRPEGHALLLKLVETADIFLTSYLPAVRARLHLDVDDLRVANPDLIYVQGTGWGVRGPMANTGGFDSAAAWCSSGTLHKLTKQGAEEPVAQPPAFYDLQGSNSLAGATAMALFKRLRTGEPSVVDVSLLSTAMWAMGPDIAAAPFTGEIPQQDRHAPVNPIVNYYRTKDGRWLNLVCLQADRYWGELCARIDRLDLVLDDRFVDARARLENTRACVEELDRTFGAKTLDEWKFALAEFTGVWAPALSVSEVHEHVQVRANGYLPELQAQDGTPFWLIAPPYQFDGKPGRPAGLAPSLGAHNEELLREAGLDEAEIADYRDSGVMSAAT
jgi:crotonobetainyl-CoA:carnitine CoA-transferase CaiB-like acyl-CoA transferase